MTKVNFELGGDATDLMGAFRQSSNAVSGLAHETLEYGELSKKVFKANADEVDKYSKDLTEGAKQTEKMRKETENLGKSKNIITELKKQIKEYTTAAHEAGEGTAAFTKNLEKAGKLKDQLNDLNAAVQSLNGNMGENLSRAAGESISIVAKGYEGLIGLQSLAGVKNEEFEQTILKLQSLNAIANIAQEFGGLSDKITEIKLGFAPVTELFRSGASTITSAYTSSNATLKNFFSDFLGNSKAALKSGVDFAKGFGSNAVSVAKSAGAGFVSFFSNFGSNMKTFASSAKAGINTVGTAIKANPMGIILTVIIAVIGAFVLLKDKVKPIADLFEFLGEIWDKAAGFLEDMAASIGLMADASEKKSEALIKGTKEEIDAIKGKYDFEIQALEAAGKSTIEKEREKSKAVKERAGQTMFELEKIRALEGKLTDEQAKQYKEAQTEMIEAVKERTIAEIKFVKEEADKQKEIQKKAAEAAKQAAEKRKQLASDLKNSLVDLAKKADQAQLEGLTGKERLDKQREIAEQELALLRDVIFKKGQLLNKNFKFSKDQQEQFNILEDRIVSDHSNGIIKLESEKAAKLAEIQSREVADALKSLELKAKIQEDSIKAIPTPGNLTKDQEAQFELEKQRQILEVRKKFLQESLLLKTQEVNGRANQEIVALQNEKAALEKNTDEISKLRVAAIDRDIAAIKENAELSKTAIVGETKATVNEINNELSKIGENTKPKKIDFAKLLGGDSKELSILIEAKVGIKVSESDIQSTKAAIQQLVSSLREIYQNYLDAANKALDQELNANQQRMDDRDKNIQDLQDKLQDEKALRDEGFANNVDRLNEEIAVQQAAKADDLANEKRIKEEKKKLAKQQLNIDTAVQASQLIVAMAQLFAQGSNFWVGPVPVGLIVAGIAATAMTVAFIDGKKKAYDAVNNSPEFYTGGYVEGKGGYSGDGDKYAPAGILHGGEYVMNKETTDENWDLLDGLHKNDKRKIEFGIRDLIKGKGIRLASDIPQELTEARSAVRNGEMNAFFKLDNSKLENRMESIEGHIKVLVQQGNDSDQILPDGSRLIKTGNITRLIRKR